MGDSCESNLHPGCSRQPKGEQIEARLMVNMVYTCTPGARKLGCLRVSYRQSTASHISYIGSLLPDGSANSWAASRSWICQGTGAPSHISLFAAGSFTAAEMLGLMEAEGLETT